MLMSANVAQAQEAVVIEEATFTEVAECADHYYSQKKDNWFIQIGAGIETLFAGVERLEVLATDIENETTHSSHIHINRVGLMWDMFNSFGNVNADRVFSIVPFVGVGGSYS